MGLLMHRIDYALLARALEYYTDAGYAYVEVPWSVPRWAVQTTCPEAERQTPFQDADDFLVGSAEQSFIYLQGTGILKPGRYCACTPCFRTGDSSDDLHHASFMKVELFDTLDVDISSVRGMLNAVSCFVKQELSQELFLLLERDTVPRYLHGVNTRYTYDLNLNGVEIGSYGLRHIYEKHPHNQKFCFGTGLAEPRFSQARDLPVPERKIP